MKGWKLRDNAKRWTTLVLLSGGVLLGASLVLSSCGAPGTPAAPPSSGWTESNGFLLRSRDPEALQVKATLNWTAFYGTSLEAVWGSPAASFEIPEWQSLHFASNRDGNWEIWGRWGANVPGLYYKLTNHPASDLTPFGLLFSSDRDGNREIYRMNPDGSNPVRLTNHPADDREPCPASVNLVRYVYFASNRDGNWEIYRMNWDGTGVTRLTNNPAEDRFPRAEGDKVYFASNRDGNWEIYRMNWDGTGLTRLTNHPANDMYPYPRLGRVYFSSDRDGNDEIYRMNSDGSGLTRLTNHPASDIMPVADSSGSIVYFVSNRSGSPELWNTNGRRLTEFNSAVSWPSVVASPIPLVAPGGSWFPDASRRYQNAFFPSGVAALAAVHPAETTSSTDERPITAIFAIDAANDESLRMPVFEGYSTDSDSDLEVFLVVLEADRITHLVFMNMSRWLRYYLVGPDARFEFVSTTARPISRIVVEFDRSGVIRRVYLGRARTRSAEGITVQRTAEQMIIRGAFDEGWERVGDAWKPILVGTTEEIRFDVRRAQFISQ